MTRNNLEFTSKSEENPTFSCTLCPRMCQVDRKSKYGYCGAGIDLSAAKIMLHHWEEPCISGTDPDRGSGAVFFTHCSLGCVFCQNSKISRRTAESQPISERELAHKMLELEKNGAYNINFVSPTHFTPQLIETVHIAREEGLTLPIVWNTGGYERPEIIETLRDTVDIFLTDFKYASPDLAEQYSSARDYPDFAARSLRVMADLVENCTFSPDGLMQRGIIVRHLVLPSHRQDSMDVLRKIASLVPPDRIKLSLMAQYTPEFLPSPHTPDPYAKIRRKITTFEYEQVTAEAVRLGFDGYMQERSSATKRFTPDF